MIKNKSIPFIFIATMAFITVLILISINTIWIRFEYKKFEDEAIAQKKEYITHEKNTLKSNVALAVESIHFFRQKYKTFPESGPSNDNRLKSIILERLSTMKFGDSGYIFAGTWEGVSLLGPEKGRNMIEVTDPHGVKIVQELIALSRTGGGFLNYVMPKFKGTEPKPKISYVIGIEDWQWYVGMGRYVDEIDTTIAMKRDELQKGVNRVIFQVLVLSGTIIALVFIVAMSISKSLNREYRVFSGFFNQSADRYKTIDIDLLSLSEFRVLAESANHMIMKRKDAERRLKATKNLLDSIINSMPSMVIGLNKALEITQWNSCAQEKTGIGLYEALGRPLTAIIPDYGQFLEDIGRAIETQKIIVKEKMLCHNGTEKCYNDLVIYPLSSDDQQGAVLRIDDVTERVKMQEIMIHNEKMLTVGGLAAGMAHEINNPLGIIIQGLQNIRKRLQPDTDISIREYGLDPDLLFRFLENRKILYYLRGMEDAGIRASNIVQNMLEFSRGSKSDRIPNNIHDIIDKSIELAISDYDMKKKFDFRKIRVIKNYSTTIGKALCSATEIEQVILNLMKNAAQAMTAVPGKDKEPRLEIKTWQESRRIMVELYDNGPGIPESIQKHIFEPFFSTKNTGEGTGLGLYVSYFIITNNHHGRISVSSREGEWTRFTIELPAVET